MCSVGMTTWGPFELSLGSPRIRQRTKLIGQWIPRDTSFYQLTHPYNVLASASSPLRQWCWGVEFHPASIMAKHGKWQFKACQLAAPDSLSIVLIWYNDLSCRFTAICEIWSHGMFQSPESDISEPYLSSGCWVERSGMLGGNFATEQGMLGGNIWCRVETEHCEQILWIIKCEFIVYQYLTSHLSWISEIKFIMIYWNN